jgi:hypothetical protein
MASFSVAVFQCLGHCRDAVPPGQIGQAAPSAPAFALVLLRSLPTRFAVGELTSFNVGVDHAHRHPPPEYPECEPLDAGVLADEQVVGTGVERLRCAMLGP